MYIAANVLSTAACLFWVSGNKVNQVSFSASCPRDVKNYTILSGELTVQVNFFLLQQCR